MSEKKSLISLFEESEYHTVKYRNYFPIYEKLFSKFVNKLRISEAELYVTVTTVIRSFIEFCPLCTAPPKRFPCS